MSERPLTIREVSERLALHQHSVKRIPAQFLPYFRANSRGDRRYEVEDVERYIAKRKVTWDR